MNDKKQSLTVLSCFDWSVPGTTELICESAYFAKIPFYHFSKPTSIFKPRTVFKGEEKKGCLRNRLLIFGTSFVKSKTLSKIQNAFVIRQIKNSYPGRSYKNSTLIYNNLESIIGVLPRLKKMYKKVIYLCLDYTDLGEDFMNNTSLADEILVIPKSMICEIENIYGDKTKQFPQLTSTYSPTNQKSKKVEELLKKIPAPRIIYTGNLKNRIDENLYAKVTNEMRECSFVSFHDNSFHRHHNIFQLPWLQKDEIFSLLEESSVGFMPYDTRVKHNLHCVPLKLFEYFQLGMPVVSTNLVNIKNLEPLLRIGENAEELIGHLRNSLGEKLDCTLGQKRKLVGEKHSTKNQTERVKAIALGVSPHDS